MILICSQMKQLVFLLEFQVETTGWRPLKKRDEIKSHPNKKIVMSG